MLSVDKSELQSVGVTQKKEQLLSKLGVVDGAELSNQVALIWLSMIMY